MPDHAPPESPYRVPFEGDFDLAASPTAPPEAAADRRELKSELRETVREISRLQRRLYADNRYAVLLVFQAMDAAGKDSTIRAVTTGVNPAGFQVFSFKAPSREELDHDFLWRTTVRLPERGRIGIFNRSHYEETLVVRVHPEFIEGQNLPREIGLEQRWQERYRSIREHEAHLARSGTVILKFWLNVSRAEQARRFVRRIDRPDKNWKFSAQDLDERAHWSAYMEAYRDVLSATSRPWAPWYAVPADDKRYMRVVVARLVREQLASLRLEFPTLPEQERATLQRLKATLLEEI